MINEIIEIRNNRNVLLRRLSVAALLPLMKNFRERFSIERLAAEVDISPSSLLEHFRAVTAMTSLRFQKQLRLQDARGLMLVQDIDVATAAFRVGYESLSLFSRDGEPPARDIARLRASTVVA